VSLPTAAPTSSDDRLERWVRTFAGPLRGYIRAWIRDDALVEDLVQEVFIKAWRGEATYIEQGHERAYLFRIADHVTIDYLRQAKERRPTPLLDRPDPRQRPPEESILRDETRDELGRAMQSLSETQRRVLLLRYFGELTFEEIACTVGCPLGTALSHARRALEELRRVYGVEPARNERRR
jgi:RNA polymerase sigma-70 factor (ECF subfamily)